MAKAISFTKDNLDRLPIPEAGRSFFSDMKVPSLRIQITANGTKSFQVVRRLGGKVKFITLGRYPDMTPEQARQKARITVSDVVQGIDPVQAKRDQKAASVTLAESLEEYINTNSRLKDSTKEDYRKEVRLTFADWANKPIASINREMVLKRFRDRSAKSEAAANRAFRVLRAVINFASYRHTDAKGDSLITSNPIEVLNQTRAWNNVQRRKTYIHNTDLPAWFEAVQSLKNETTQEKGEVVRDFLIFLLFTGVRREEALQLTWSDINFHDRTFTLRDTKNRETVTLPLNSQAFEVLQTRHSVSESNAVFQGDGSSGRLINPTKQIKRVIAASGIEFSCHDLRRTFITAAESLDISLYTLKRLVNHKTGERSDVTAGYVVPDLNRQRLASQRVGDALFAACTNKPVSPLIAVPDGSNKRVG